MTAICHNIAALPTDVINNMSNEDLFDALEDLPRGSIDPLWVLHAPDEALRQTVHNLHNAGVAAAAAD